MRKAWGQIRRMGFETMPKKRKWNNAVYPVNRGAELHVKHWLQALASFTQALCSKGLVGVAHSLNRNNIVKRSVPFAFVRVI